MDKNNIKKFAIWARRELISKVSQRAAFYGIKDTETIDANADNINNKVLTASEKKQRQALIAKIKKEGYEQVMEEVAYTWFNRFVAIRYMEVNGYLPTHIRVFTDENGAFKPQILAEAINLDLDGLDMEKVYALKDANDDEALYKYLFVAQCNALNVNLPYMFAKIEDYTELLLPDYLLREGSVIEQMISQIPEEDWTDQVQIIGWLYQYYNSEKKDQVFEALKKNVKITKENIPAATQLFTPDWIVRYMVENSLGRLWTEGHPDTDIKSNWKYYLEEAEQEPEVEAELVKIRAEYAKLTPEDIKVIDPCMGSGHILVYAFEVLMQIYESAGYTQRDAAELIVEKNIYGIDIDDRAGQLAYFAVMMMARKYNRRILTKGLTPNVMAIQDSSNVNVSTIEFIANGNDKIKNELMKIKTVLADAKEYGSILNVPEVNFEAIYTAIEACQDREGDLIAEIEKNNAVSEVLPIVKQAQVMAQKYSIVITNPPYMGGSGMSAKLSDFVKEKYPDSKSDLFACFIEKCPAMLKRDGMYAMITQHAFMFLSSYEKLREKMQKKTTINMAHLGARAFDEIGGEVVQTTAFVNRNAYSKGYQGLYARLVDVNGEAEKEKLFLCGEKRHFAKQENFSKIPGMPVAYWVSDSLMKAFADGVLLGTIADSKQGLATADNNRFLRLWYEVNINKVKFDARSHSDALSSRKKWFPYNKGGQFRKWYGNNDYLVNWENDGLEIKHFVDNNGKLRSRPQNLQYMFRSSVSWSDITSSTNAFRYKPTGHLFDITGMSLFSDEYDKYLLALCNTMIGTSILKIIAPTMHCQCGDVASIPVYLDNQRKQIIEELVLENIDIAKKEWDSYEVSWDFTNHPLISSEQFMSRIYSQWTAMCDSWFEKIKQNEEALNAHFFEIYGVTNEFTSVVNDCDITIRRADIQRDVRSFVSYAIGCILGRYSLDVEGLAYAGGTWDLSKYATFVPDGDNIIPICDDEYFDDDIVSRFVDFVKVVYGEDTLEENLKFIADALGGKGTPREVIRNYFLNDFFADHCKTYQKRPIYWLFDSGKKNGLKCLIYMHRYQPDTIARIRTDYVHEQQSRYRTAIEEIEGRIDSVSQSEKVKLSKKLKTLQEQAEELRVYEEKIHHLADQMISIDLDDGVKVNYAKFQDVLAKIK